VLPTGVLDGFPLNLRSATEESLTPFLGQLGEMIGGERGRAITEPGPNGMGIQKGIESVTMQHQDFAAATD
jgi:hypothetical protein